MRLFLLRKSDVAQTNQTENQCFLNYAILRVSYCVSRVTRLFILYCSCAMFFRNSDINFSLALANKVKLIALFICQVQLYLVSRTVNRGALIDRKNDLR